MKKDVITIEATESTEASCSCLNKNNFRRVPVVIKNKLVGVVTRKDVISHIFNLQPCQPTKFNNAQTCCGGNRGR